MNNRWGLAGLRNDLSRLRPRGSRGRSDKPRSLRRSSGGARYDRRTRLSSGRPNDDSMGRGSGLGSLRILGSALGLFLAGQNCLHDVAGLGDIGEINFGAVILLGTLARRRGRTGASLEMATDFLRLVLLDGAGVGFAVGHIHVFQSV